MTLARFLVVAIIIAVWPHSSGGQSGGNKKKPMAKRLSRAEVHKHCDRNNNNQLSFEEFARPYLARSPHLRDAIKKEFIRIAKGDDEISKDDLVNAPKKPKEPQVKKPTVGAAKTAQTTPVKTILGSLAIPETDLVVDVDNTMDMFEVYVIPPDQGMDEWEYWARTYAPNETPPAANADPTGLANAAPIDSWVGIHLAGFVPESIHYDNIDDFQLTGDPPKANATRHLYIFERYREWGPMGPGEWKPWANSFWVIHTHTANLFPNP